MRLNHGSLFNGIGGFQLAAAVMGWRNVFHCEIDPFCNKVAAYHFPNSILHNDIRETDFSRYRGAIDIVSGGFPCQPFSDAGQRKGTADNRYLWPEMLRAIKQIQPRWVVPENVRGLINWKRGLVFQTVLSDLAVAGYETISFLLPACGVNAPHQRYRVWIIAYANSIYRYPPGTQGLDSSRRGAALHHPDGIDGEGFTPDPDIAGLQGGQNTTEAEKRREIRDEFPGGSYKLTDWTNFPTQSPVCFRDDGLPSGMDGITFSDWHKQSLMAIGNAIVPAQAVEIFKAIQAFEDGLIWPG